MNKFRRMLNVEVYMQVPKFMVVASVLGLLAWLVMAVLTILDYPIAANLSLAVMAGCSFGVLLEVVWQWWKQASLKIFMEDL